MGDDNTTEQQKKRKAKWTTSYSNMSILEAEKRLGFMMGQFVSKAISVERMLAEAKYMFEGEGPDAVLKTKEDVYSQIVRYLDIEGYPTEADAELKEANINDLVYAIINPILFDFRRQTGRNIRLLREKEIVSVDSETGGAEEFVMMDLISVMERNFVLVIEAKRSSFGQAMKQCLLTMKDMRDNNGGGEVYGFVTTGDSWRMLRYDGKDFCLTRKIHPLFEGMDQEKELWMKDCSALVDCMNAALSNGGIVKK